jgi:hypothetical protein
MLQFLMMKGMSMKAFSFFRQACIIFLSVGWVFIACAPQKHKVLVQSSQQEKFFVQRVFQEKRDQLRNDSTTRETLIRWIEAHAHPQDERERNFSSYRSSYSELKDKIGLNPLVDHFSLGVSHDLTDRPSTNRSLSEKKINSCSDDSIYRVYESLLVKSAFRNVEFSREIFSLYKRVIEQMQNNSRLTRPNGSGEQVHSIDLWNLEQNTLPLPVTQKQSRQQTKLNDLLMPHLVGTDFVLALDYILYNAKGLDGIGMDPYLRELRDLIFNQKIKVIRGTRKDQLPVRRLRSQFGIANHDVPALEYAGAQPWPHWGRDICQLSFFAPGTYNYYADLAGVPIVCGVSGTSSMALWGILASGVTFSVDEWRLLIFSIWVGMCLDGGHSLQEVLSSMKVNADFFFERMNDSQFRARLSEETILDRWKLIRSRSFWLLLS